MRAIIVEFKAVGIALGATAVLGDLIAAGIWGGV
jgi:hypothetical protein